VASTTIYILSNYTPDLSVPYITHANAKELRFLSNVQDNANNAEMLMFCLRAHIFLTLADAQTQQGFQHDRGIDLNILPITVYTP